MRIFTIIALIFSSFNLAVAVGFSKQGPPSNTQQNPSYPYDHEKLPTTLPQAKVELAKAEKLLAKAQAQALAAYAGHPKIQQAFNTAQREWAAYSKAELAYATATMEKDKSADMQLPLTNIKLILTRQRTSLINDYFTMTSTVTDVTPKQRK